MGLGEVVTFVERSALEAEFALPLAASSPRRNTVKVEILGSGVELRLPEGRRLCLEVATEVDAAMSSSSFDGAGRLVIRLCKKSGTSPWGSVRLRESRRRWWFFRALGFGATHREVGVKLATPSLLESLPDDVLARVLARLPMDCLGWASCASRKLKKTLSSNAFRIERVSRGCAEPLVVVAGGQSERMLCSAGVAMCRLGPRGLAHDFGLRLPRGRRASTAIKLSDRLALVGGFLADGLPTTSCVALSFTERQFVPFASMRCARAGHAVGKLSDGTLVAAGGLGGPGVVASVEIYADERWRPGPAMPRSTCFAASGVLRTGGRDLLVVAGGEDGTDILDDCQAFDGRNWTLRARMPVPVCATAGAVYHNALYVFGGWSDKRFAADRVLSYDACADEWRYGPDLGCRLTFASACVAPAGLLVVAGPILLLLAGPRGNETITRLDCESVSRKHFPDEEEELERSRCRVPAAGFLTQAALALVEI